MIRVKKLFSVSLLFSLVAASSLPAMELSTIELSRESIRGNRLGPIGLSYDEEGFTVKENDLSTRVHRYDTDSIFKGKSKKQIAAFAAMGKFKVSKFDNGEYAVRAHGDINGGGPALAVAAAVSVRALGWFCSLPFLFIPGGQAIFLAGCAITENVATVATAAALVAPTP